MSHPPTILFTGGRGRMGGAVRSACAGEWNLRLFSRTAGDGLEDLESLLGGSEPLSAAALIHGAWSTVPATAELDPGAAERSDLPLLRRIIARLERESAPPLLVFLSTGAVYGPAPGRPSREDDTPHPIGAYARGKLLGEQLLATTRIPHCVLRIGNVYSLHSTPRDAQGVIGHLVRCALSGATFQHWGGDSTKDYLHRDDFIDALRLVIAHRLEGTWNLGSGTGTRLSELIRLVEQATGRALKTETQPARDWDVSDNRLDVSRITGAIPWRARIAIADGIASEVARAGRQAD